MLKKSHIYFILLFAFPLFVQGQDQSYDKILVDLTEANSVLQNSLSKNWKASPGIHLNIRADYHLGQLELGGRYTHYSANNLNYQNVAFKSYFIYVGWQYSLNITKKLSIAPGLRFGNNLMSFNKPAAYQPDEEHENWGTYNFNDTESEFAYELFTRLEYKLGNSPWRIHSSFSYNRTLTYHPLPSGFLSFGISRSFSTPTWLKNFLQ